MQKKASSVLLILIDVLAVVFICLIVLEISYKMSESPAVKKLGLAKNLVLLENTLFAVPVSTEITYPEDLSKFIIDIEDNKVEVYMNELELDMRHVTLYSIPYYDFIAKQHIKDSPQMFVFKEGDTMKLLNKEQLDKFLKRSLREAVPSIITQDLQWRNRKIILAPETKDGDKDTFVESIKTGISIRANGQPEVEQQNTNNLPAKDAIAALIIFEPAVSSTIQIYFTQSPATSAKGRKLAVLIKNALLDEFPEITSIQTLQSQEQALTYADASVIIKLPQTMQPDKISAALYNALQQYYEKQKSTTVII